MSPQNKIRISLAFYRAAPSNGPARAISEAAMSVGRTIKDGAATAVGMLTLAARFRRSGTMYRNHGSGRDSPLEVNIGPGVSAT